MIRLTPRFRLPLVRLLAVLAAPCIIVSAACAQPELAVERSDGQGVQILYQAPALELSPDTVDGRAFQRLRVPGTLTTGLPGAPALPARELLVGVPFGVDVHFEVEATGAPRVVEALAAPRVDPRDGSPLPGGRPAARVQLDAAEYSRAGFAPGVLGRLVGVSTLRDQRVARIELYPVQVSPATGRLRAYSALRVRVTWSGRESAAPLTSPSASAPGGLQDPLEDLYRRSILNYEEARAFRRAPVSHLDNPVGGPDFFTSSTGPWVRMKLSRHGIYEVGQSDLQAAGLSAADIAAIDVSTIRVFTSPSAGLPLSESQDCDSCFMREVDCDVENASGSPVAGSAGLVVGDRVVFYGTASNGFPEEYFADTTTTDTSEYLRNEFTNENVYWITWGAGSSFPDPPRRMAHVTSLTADQAGGGVFASLPARVHLEQDVFYDANTFGLNEPRTRWEKWWWQQISSSSAGYYVPESPFILPGADTTAPARAMFRFWGTPTGTAWQVNVAYQQDPQHVTLLDSVVVPGSSAPRMDLTTSFQAKAGGNQFIVSAPLTVPPQFGNRRNRNADSYLAFLNVNYLRRLSADQGSLFFRAPQTGAALGYALQGFSAQRQVFAVRNFGSVERIDGGTADFFGENVDGGRAYLVIEPSARLHPAKLELSAYRGLSATYLHDTRQGADDIIITYDGFRQYADELREWRSGHLFHVASPRVTVAGIQQIYDEFSGGRFDPTALRNFSRYAYRHWARPGLSYMTILGDCSSDFKDLRHLSPGGQGITNFVPIYENSVSLSGLPLVQFSTDDWYAMVSDASFTPDFAIGRLPASNLNEAKLLVEDKTIAYEKNPEFGQWRCRFLLGADDLYLCHDPDGLGYYHIQQAEEQANRFVPPELEVRKVYLQDYAYGITDECSKPGAEHDFVQALNEGVLATGYVGHGNPVQIAHEKLFANADLGSLHNGRRLSWFIAASCQVGQVDDPTRNGLAESLLKLANAGTVASYAATEEAYANESVPMEDSLLVDLFDRSDGALGHPIGLAVMLGKLEYTHINSVRGYYRDNSTKYVLQGDPALILGVPPYEIRFDAPPATARQGQVVELPFTIYRGFGSGAVATDFEGSDTMSAQEPPVVHKLNYDGFNIWNYADSIYLTPGGTIFRGLGTVHSGRGTLRFFMPAGSRRGPQTRYRIYAQGRLGSGVLTDAVGTGVLTTVSGTFAEDDDGPVLAVTLSGDSRDVKPGTLLHVIARSPHGIYLGQQPLNSIFVSIDGGRRTLLNDLFAYKPDSVTVGTVDFSMPPLEPGVHTLLVSAASNLASSVDRGRHRTTVSLTFAVAGGGPTELQNVFNYPNPVRAGETDLYFSSKNPGDATITLYTVSGHRIRTLRGTSNGGTSHVHWDLRDADQDLVANGTYLFQVEVTGVDGQVSKAMGKIVVLRN